MIKRKNIRKEKQRKEEREDITRLMKMLKKKNERKLKKKIARTGKVNEESRKEYCINCR